MDYRILRMITHLNDKSDKNSNEVLNYCKIDDVKVF